MYLYACMYVCVMHVCIHLYMYWGVYLVSEYHTCTLTNTHIHTYIYIGIHIDVHIIVRDALFLNI